MPFNLAQHRWILVQGIAARAHVFRLIERPAPEYGKHSLVIHLARLSFLPFFDKSIRIWVRVMLGWPRMMVCNREHTNVAPIWQRIPCCNPSRDPNITHHEIYLVLLAHGNPGATTPLGAAKPLNC